MRLLGALVVLVAGCFTVDPTNGVYRCHAGDNACPTGYVCSTKDYRCYRAGFVPDFGTAGHPPTATGPDLSPENDGFTTPDDGPAAVVSQSRSSIDLAPATPLANGQSQVTITVTVRDDSGSSLSGYNVTLSATGSGNTITQPAAPTGQDGTAVGAMASTTAEMKTISAVVGGVTLTKDVRFAQPVAATLLFSAQPPNAGPGQILNPAVRVTVRDANTVALPGASVALTLANNTSSATLSGGTTATTGADGVAVFDSLQVDKAQSGYRLVATCQSVMATSGSFNIVVGLPNPPTGVTASAAASTITVMWNSVSGATGYNVLRSTTSGNEVQIASNVNTTSYTDSNLRRGTYYYEVETVNSIGSSIPSLEVTANADIEICVANYSGNSVVAVTGGQNQSVTALRSVSMGVASPFAVATDLVNNEIFVANFLAGTVLVFNRTDTSTSSAKRTITGLSRPSALVVDTAAGELYVANLQGSTVQVFDHTANGAATAKRTISGSATLLNAPQGIALDKANNELWVANDGDDSLDAFATSANGNVAPLRTIKGSNTLLNSVANIAYDTTDATVIVASQGGIAVSAFDRTASGNVGPHWMLQGASTSLQLPSSVAFDPVPAGGGEIYVTNSASVTVYGARHAQCGSPCTILNQTPSRTITSTSFSGPNGVAICN